MAPLKPLNPLAKEWKPVAQYRLPNHNIIPSPLKQISPLEIFTKNKLQDSCMTTFFYYTCSPFSQFRYYQTIPLNTPVQKDEFCLKGEKALKQVLKIDVEEEKKGSGRRQHLPPRLRKRWSLVEDVGQRNTSKKWRAKNVKSEGKVVTFPSPPAPVSHVCCKTKTTIMIKNIPNQFSKKSLMEFLDPYCLEHQLEYDFFYLPMDFRTDGNLGFAFVNFTTAAAALKAKKVLQNHKWGVVVTPRGEYTSKKICELTWARIQGKEALMEHFEKSCFVCKNKDYLPVVLSPPRNGANALSSKMSNVGRMLG